MGVIKSIFKPRDKPKNHAGDSIGGGRSFPFGRAWSGKSVTERSAMQTTAVYACVRIISETVASLPIERAFTHPLYRLLHDIPNPEMNSFIMREVMMSHLLLWGNSYSQIIRNGKGEVTALYPLMPEKMRIDRGADSKIYYTYNSDKQGTFVFRKDEILHIVGLGFGILTDCYGEECDRTFYCCRRIRLKLFLKQRYTKRSFGTSGSFERA